MADFVANPDGGIQEAGQETVNAPAIEEVKAPVENANPETVVATDPIADVVTDEPEEEKVEEESSDTEESDSE